MADESEQLTAVDAGEATEPAKPAKPAMSEPSVKLNGMQKAAVLMITLGTERSSQIMKNLDPDDAEPLVVEIARTQNLPPEYVYVVMNEIVESALARGYFYEGGVDYARQMLIAAFGEERATDLLARLQTVIETRPFKFLSRTPPEQIYSFVRHEHPQLVALLLAYLGDSQSSAVLQMFPAKQQADLVKRIATMGQVTPEAVAQLEATVRSKMHVVAVSETSKAGGVEAAAGLINRVDRQTERNVFENLGEDQPQLAEEIRALLFVFEDITRLDTRAIQQIVQKCEQSDLALALRGATADAKRIFFENMSERMAETISEEIELMPPQRRKDVEEAQTAIVAVTRQLEEAGDIQIFRGADADEVI
jgi:flagellar motor switch protein FliG